MIHVALIASLVVGGAGTTGIRSDWPSPHAFTGSGPDTLLTTSARIASAGQPAASAGTDAAILDNGRHATGPRAGPTGFRRVPDGDRSFSAGTTAPADTAPPKAKRPRAIEYSDWYYRRLTMHRIGSYVEFPLFAAEYILGENLLRDQQQLGFVPPGRQQDSHRVPPSLLTAHTLVAGGLGVLFGFNTITGGWNLWEARKEPVGRTRRIVHTVLMLAADAGFAATGAAGGGAKHSQSNADTHRGLAEASMGVAGAGTIMMWIWNR
jgi:hypothetical protein